MFNLQIAYYKSPIGMLEIKGNEEGIISVVFVDERIILTNSEDPKLLIPCLEQLDEYFKKERKEFSLKLNFKGTEFQQKVWKTLLEVPFGTTKSYLEQAKSFGNVDAIRAIASANGKNPISIIVPCHRIIGTDGSLTGYAGGLWRKKWLLEHEGRFQKQQTLFDF